MVDGGSRSSDTNDRSNNALESHNRSHRIIPNRQSIAFFGTHPLSLFELGVCFGFSLLIFVWIEGENLFVRWFLSRG